MIFSIEKKEPKEYLRIYETGYDTSCGYYSQNCWVDDDRLVISRCRNPKNNATDDGMDIILVDLTDNSEKHLVHLDSATSTVVHGTTLYYTENAFVLCSIDVDTLERKEIYKSDDEPIGFPHITTDGRYLNWSYEGTKGVTQYNCNICYRIDLKTGEVIKMVEKGFLPPFKVADHFMINPVNPDIMFFAHEGDTTYISNRLWLAPLGKEPYNIAKQRLDENGSLIDCFGHESWAADGKGLYFVKYAVSPSKPTGIGYVDIESGKHEILFTGNKYWHVCVSPNGKYLASDIGPNDLDADDLGNSGVCLIDLEKGTEEVIARVKNQRSHPGHPHPQFNPSCTRLCFHDAVDKETLAVGVINI